MKIMIANDGLHAHYYERMAWAKAFNACGHRVSVWDINQTSPFDAFDKFEPDIFLGQSYNLDAATIKCIYERPHLKVGYVLEIGVIKNKRLISLNSIFYTARNKRKIF